MLVPRSTCDDVDPAVAVDIHGDHADIGRGLDAEQVPCPPIRGLEVVPVDVPILLMHDEVRNPVGINIGDGGLSEVDAGRVCVDVMMPEVESPGTVRFIRLRSTTYR